MVQGTALNVYSRDERDGIARVLRQYQQEIRERTEGELQSLRPSTRATLKCTLHNADAILSLWVEGLEPDEVEAAIRLLVELSGGQLRTPPLPELIQSAQEQTVDLTDEKQDKVRAVLRVLDRVWRSFSDADG